MDKIPLGIMWYIAFLFSTVLHEASHAFFGLKLGDRTAYEGGQVTLDPLPHIKREPFGTILIPILSFFLYGWMIGWASAPFDPTWAYRNPKNSAKMALAGPMANFSLVILSALLMRLGLAYGIFVPPESISFSSVVEASSGGIVSAAATLLSIFFTLNLVLMVFNLIPLPPLDGSSIIPLFLKEKKGQKYLDFVWNPQFRMIGIFAAWFLFSRIFYPFHLIALNVLYLGISSYG
jgi:Zn-dependent protease